MTAPTITVHPSPVWRSKADFAAFAVVDDAAGRPPWFEQVAGRAMADDQMEICCIPLAAYDLSVGDIVGLVRRDGSIFIENVVLPSEWYSYRAMVLAANASSLRLLLEELSGVGVVHEMGNPPAHRVRSTR